MRPPHYAASRTGSHVAKNLSPINAYPIESGVRKDVAIWLNVNERHQMKWLNEHVIPGEEIFRMYHKKRISNIP